MAQQLAEDRTSGMAGLAMRMFGHPTGRLGRLGGRMMLRHNSPDYAWIAAILDPDPDDVFLEVGCGPGGLLRAVQERAGRVVGVDPSPVMVHLAAATSGVEVHEACAERLPFGDSHFTLVCAMHTIDFWESIDAGLAEILRVLEPGGRAAIVVRKLDPSARSWEPARYGFDAARLEELHSAMVRAGFSNVERYDTKPGAEDLVALVGLRGARGPR